MSLIIDPTAQNDTPSPASEPEQTPNADGMMTPVIMLFCPRCHAQAAMEVRPMMLLLRSDGVLVVEEKEGEEIIGQAFVVGMSQPQAKCPQCSSGGIIVPNGGMPPNLKL